MKARVLSQYSFAQEAKVSVGDLLDVKLDIDSSTGEPVLVAITGDGERIIAAPDRDLDPGIEVVCDQ